MAATQTQTQTQIFYPETPSSTSSPSPHSPSSKCTQLRHTIWACIRLGRLHTTMAYAIFPAPAIYSIVLFFALHKPTFTTSNIPTPLILQEFTSLLLRTTIVIMSYRSAGLAWDDLIDRSYDAHVPRTKSRPLPAGDVSVDVACLYIAVQALVTVVLVQVLLPGQMMYAMIIGAAVFIPYPFMKRFTASVQVFGAVLIAIGVLQGWAACVSSPIFKQVGLVVGEMEGWMAFLGEIWRSKGVVGRMLGMEICFELAHELVYGNQDTADDIKLGLHSLSIFLGPSKSYICVIIALAGFTWQFAVILLQAELVGAKVIVGIVAAVLVWETARLQMTEPQSCGRWAKRGVQIKMFLCVALPASLALTYVQG